MTWLRRNWRLQVAGCRLQVAGAGRLPAGFLLWAILNVQKHNKSGCYCGGIIVWCRYRGRHYQRNWISAKYSSR